MKKTILVLLLVLGTRAYAAWRPQVLAGSSAYSGQLEAGVYGDSLGISLHGGLGNLLGFGMPTIDAGLSWDAAVTGAWHPWGATGGFCGASLHLVQARRMVVALAPMVGARKSWKHWGVHADVSVPVYLGEDGPHPFLNSPDDQEDGKPVLEDGKVAFKLGAGLSWAW